MRRTATLRGFSEKTPWARLIALLQQNYRNNQIVSVRAELVAGMVISKSSYAVH